MANETGLDTVAIAGSIDVIGVAKEGEEVANDVVGQSGTGAVRLEIDVWCLTAQRIKQSWQKCLQDARTHSQPITTERGGGGQRTSFEHRVQDWKPSLTVVDDSATLPEGT